MQNYNLTIIDGCIIKDPQIKEGKNGYPIVKFSVANNGYGTKIDPTLPPVSFFDIIYWPDSKTPEMGKLKKGIRVRIIGSLSQWRWQDEGKKKSKIHIIAKNVDFLSKNKKPKFI